ncbi:MAG: hypothetical protein J0H11_14580 [Rhizobiales bacterium]|nr:hypothetical protein [Hyphomicrobiales bacterium]
MAEETKQKTAPAPILEWMDGDAALVCAGPACTFGADATVTPDKAEPSAAKPDGTAVSSTEKSA